jgi:hypothetical protein
MVAVASPLSPPVIGGERTRDPQDSGRHLGAFDRSDDASDGLQVHGPRLLKAPPRTIEVTSGLEDVRANRWHGGG